MKAPEKNKTEKRITNRPAERKLISRVDASERYQRSEASMWRDERDGLIPTAIRIRGRKFWLLADLDKGYGLTTAGDEE